MQAVPEPEAGNTQFEQSLAELRPATPALSRDLVMFRAGRASARSPSRLWQGVSTALACALAVSLIQRPQPTQRADGRERRPVPQDTIATAEPIPWPAARADVGGLSGGGYIHLRNAVLDRGMDALPEPRALPPGRPAEMTRQAWIKAMLSS